MGNLYLNWVTLRRSKTKTTDSRLRLIIIFSLHTRMLLINDFANVISTTAKLSIGRGGQKTANTGTPAPEYEQRVIKCDGLYSVGVWNMIASLYSSFASLYRACLYYSGRHLIRVEKSYSLFRPLHTWHPHASAPVQPPPRDNTSVRILIIIHFCCIEERKKMKQQEKKEEAANRM